MKKSHSTTILAVLATSMLITNVQLHAEETTNSDIRPYIGADIGYMSADYKTESGINYGDLLDDSFASINPYIGLELNKHVSVEVGYMQTGTGKKSYSDSGVTLDSKLKVKGYHADVIGRYPIADKIDLLGSVGIARLKANVSYTINSGATSAKDSANDTAWRLGVGTAYHLTDNVQARAMLRYMKVDFSDTTDNLTQASMGLSYRF